MMSNVPKLRFKEFSGEWEKNIFKNIVKLQRGSSPRPIVKYVTTSKDGVNWIKIGDIVSEKNFIDSTKEKITQEGAKNSRKVSIGEIILSNSMSYGKPIILNIDGYIHDGWFVIRGFENSFNKSYLLQVLGSEWIQKQYKRLAAGGVVNNISSELVNSVKINLPTKQEQEKIASFLTSVDTKIQLLTKKEELLSSYKKGVMQKIFSGEIRFKADDGSNFPEWEEKKFSDNLDMPNNIKPNVAEKDKLLTVKLHQKGIFKSTNTDSLSMGATYYVRKKGQFIYGKQNLFNGAFGILPEKYDNYLTSTDVPTLNFKENVINPKYFLFFLGRKEYYTRLEVFASGTGSKRIHEKTLLDLKALFPCIEEQTKIANFLSSIDSKTEQVQKQLDSTREFKKALLQQMFV